MSVRAMVAFALVAGAGSVFFPKAAGAQTPRYNIVAVSVTAEEVAIAGGMLGFSATLASNSSQATPPFHWAVYLTTDGTIEHGRLLARFGPTSLGAQERATFDRTAPLPAGVTGLYTIGVFADVDNEVVEYNKLDNQAFARSFTDIRAEAASLVVTSVGAQEQRLREGERVHVSYTVRNDGRIPATVGVTAYLGLHAGLISTADLPLGSLPLTIAAGTSASGMIMGSVPERRFTGDYAVGIVLQGMGSSPPPGVSTFGVAREPLNIYRAALSLASDTLPDGTVSIPYEAELSAAGGDGHFTYRIASGALPPELSLEPGSGVISGVPRTSGAFPLEIEVASNRLTDRRAFTLTIRDTGAQLTIVNLGIINGSIGLPYSQILVAAGGEPPYTWALTPSSGDLPPGIMLRAEGALTGIPTAFGTYAFGLTVTDLRQNRAMTEYTMTVSPPVNVVVLLKGPAPIVVGEPVDFILEATGGKPPYTWAAASTPPPGMRITPQGRIVGIAEQIGNFQVRVRATDMSRARNMDTALIQVTVKDDGKLQIITPAGLPIVTPRSQYQAVIEAMGGKPPYMWSLVPGDHLPGGFYLVQGDGQKAPLNTARIYGLTVRQEPAVFTVRVEDVAGRRADRIMILTKKELSGGSTSSGCRCVLDEGSAEGASQARFLAGALVLLLARRRRR